jgi:hypothetical protein
VTDWVTISSLGTAGGTLVLAIATFSSVKSSIRSARVAERSLLAGLRPVLIPSRDGDDEQVVRFGDGHKFKVGGHGGAVDVVDGNLYMGLAVRNGGSGLAVIHGWQALMVESARGDAPDIERFHRQQRDLYIPAGDTGFWQGAIRDQSDPYETVRRIVESGERLSIDVLYGDYEGGQRTVARFGLSMRIPAERADANAEPNPSDGSAEPDPPKKGEYRFRAEVIRYFNVDSGDPR